MTDAPDDPETTGPVRRRARRLLPYGAITTAAQMSGCSPDHVGRIVRGDYDWHKARPVLIRGLHAVGWAPGARPGDTRYPKQRQLLTLWLQRQAAAIAPVCGPLDNPDTAA